MSASFALLATGIGLSIINAVYRLPEPAQLYAYAPHMTCLQGDEKVITLQVQGDLEIFISYIVLGSIFMFLFSTLNFLPWYYRFFIFLTGVFVYACGTGHYFDTVTMYESAYYYKSINTTVTGKISLATAIYSVCLLPMVAKSVKKFKGVVEKVDKI